MDPYFKPILISGAMVILLNTVFILPFNWAPFLSYVLGGLLAAYMFAKELHKNSGNFVEVKISDVLILGICVGIFAGGVLAFIIALKLQEPATKQFLIDLINKSMKMRSRTEFERIGDIGPVFLIVMSAVTMFVCGLGTCFGAMMALPFVNPKRK